MKSFLIGNDISVRWRITDCEGNPVGLTGRNLRLFVIDRGGSTEIKDFSSVNSTVMFTHYGKDQEYTGVVSLRLVENMGEKGMKTIGECRAYNITGDSCCATGGFCDGISVELTSEVETGAPGYSAYEVACMNGFEGSEQEWLETLKGDSAYAVAVEQGFEGTKGEWLASLKGDKGDTSKKGVDYFTTEDIASLDIPKKVSQLENDSKYVTGTQLSDSVAAQKKYADESAESKIQAHDSSESAHYFLRQQIGLKVDKRAGYALSKNDFTDALKKKLDSLENYDDSAVRNLIGAVQRQLDTLVDGDTQGVIDSFNEIESFLQGITETETLTGLLEELKSQLQTQIDGKVSKEEGKGLSANDFTDEDKEKLDSLQNYDDTTVGNLIKGLEQDIDNLQSHKQDTLVSGTNIKTINGKSILGPGNMTLDLSLYKVVESLPETDIDPNKIYLVLNTSGEDGNEYTEYVYLIDTWEELGTYKATVDLTPYLKKEDAAQTYLSKTDASATYATKTELGGKVDKVEGTGLSTNDYTNEEKGKVAKLQPFSIGVIEQLSTSSSQQEIEAALGCTCDELAAAILAGRPILITDGTAYSPVVVASVTDSLITMRLKEPTFYGLLGVEIYCMLGKSGGTWAFTTFSLSQMLSAENIADNLTTESYMGNYVLSANQGKVLKDMVDSLEASMASQLGDVQGILEKINNETL